MNASPEQTLADVDRLLNSGQTFVAALLLAALEAREPATLRVVVRRARWALLVHQPCEALNALDRLDRDEAGRPDTLAWRVRAWLAAENPDRAFAEAAVGVQAGATHADAVGLCATLLIEAGQPGRAASLAGLALNAGFRSAALAATLALARLCAGDPAGAQAAIVCGLAIEPEHSQLRRLHGTHCRDAAPCP